MTTTSDVTPATWRDLIDISYQLAACSLQPESWKLRAESSCSTAFFFHAVEFIVQRLQTDPEDLRGPGLVVVHVIQRQQDQLPLGFIHRRPRRERHRGE